VAREGWEEIVLRMQSGLKEDLDKLVPPGESRQAFIRSLIRRARAERDRFTAGADRWEER
jgi:hypothetical protein